MCGIAGFADRELRDGFAPARSEAEFGLVHRMCEVIRHRGPGRRGDSRRARRRPRHAPPEHHRPVRPASSRSTTKTARSGSSSTARSTTTASCAPSSRRPATASTRRATPRSIVHAYEQWGEGRVRAAARHVRHRALGSSDAARCCSRATASASSRCTTPSANGRLYFGSEIKSLLGAPARSTARSTSTRSITTCRSSTRRATARSSRACASCRPGICLRWRDGRAQRRAVLADRRSRDRSQGTRSRGRRAAARGAGRRGALAHDQRRAARRVSLRRRRLERRRRPDGASLVAAPVQDVLDRLRRAGSSTSSSTRARSREHFGTDHHEFVVRPDGLSILDRADRALRRAVRRFVGDPDVVRLGDRAAARDRGAVGRRRRRAVRRLRPLPAASARGAVRSAAARPAARALRRSRLAAAAARRRAARTSCATSRATTDGPLPRLDRASSAPTRSAALYSRRRARRAAAAEPEHALGAALRALRRAAAGTAG